jgi:ribosomal protein S18 acetylase RimI-like enzyme
MSHPFSIRDFTPSDVYDYESDLLAIAADIPGEYWSRDNFLHELPEKWHLSFAVGIDDRPIAYAILSKKTADIVHLHHFMVAAEYRNRSIGSDMMIEMEKRVGRLNCTQLTLKGEVQNVAAQRFYERHGFCYQGLDGRHRLMHKHL